MSKVTLFIGATLEVPYCLMANSTLHIKLQPSKAKKGEKVAISNRHRPTVIKINRHLLQLHSVALKSIRNGREGNISPEKPFN